jgi:outer membrane protein TolC
VDAQQRRFKAGEGTALDVARVVQQQREADLRVLRATVDLALAHIALDDLRGALLERLQVTPE